MFLKSLGRKGIILAGGTGSRLCPLTKGISKQLMPIYYKLIIYYPLTKLMNAVVNDFFIITRSEEKDLFRNLLGDDNQIGININYATQEKPESIAQAFIIGSDFIQDEDVVLILGDNLLHGDNLLKHLKEADYIKKGGTIFAYYFLDPSKIIHELNWTPRLSFGEALEKTKKWFLNNQDWFKFVKSKANYNWYRIA